jgi:hypothetical protein
MVNNYIANQHQIGQDMSMAGYTKLFNSILASTIWREDDKTRIIWITMLAMADKNGLVEASIPGLADMARITVDECEASLLKLSSPDKYSRTPEHEGRRIMAVAGGWSLLNHAKYRAKMGADERREYLRLKKRESRERHKTTPQKQSTRRQHGVDTSTASTHADSEAKADSEEKKKEVTLTLPFPSLEFKAAWEMWQKFRAEIKKKLTPSMIGAQLADMAKMGENRAIAMIEHTIRKGWQGLREEEGSLFGQPPRKPKIRLVC